MGVWGPTTAKLRMEWIGDDWLAAAGKGQVREYDGSGGYLPSKQLLAKPVQTRIKRESEHFSDDISVFQFLSSFFKEFGALGLRPFGRSD